MFGDLFFGDHLLLLDLNTNREREIVVLEISQKLLYCKYHEREQNINEMRQRRVHFKRNEGDSLSLSLSLCYIIDWAIMVKTDTSH
jgi:hypothetical protein